MRSQQKHYTEPDEHSLSVPSISPKLGPNSLCDQDFLKRGLTSPPRYLTVKVHEAKLLVDISILGKMTTYAKFQIGPLTWKTSVDKESHMNPKWNESKTFELVDLYRYASGMDQVAKNIIIKEFLPQKINNKQEKPVKNAEAQIIVGLYDQAFLHDMLIGEVRINLFDIHKAKLTSEWYVLKNKGHVIGSIHLTFKFEFGDEELSTNITHGDAPLSSLKLSSSDSHFHIETHNRVATEPHEPIKYFGTSKPNLNPRNYPSNQSDYPRGHHSSLGPPKIQRIIPNQSSDFKNNAKGGNIHWDKFSLYKKPPSGHSLTSNLGEKEYEIMITNEDENEDIESTIHKGDAFTNFSNTQSSEEKKSEFTHSDMTDWNAYLEGNLSEDNSCVLDPEPNTDLQKYLEAVRKTNYELEIRKNELNSKRSALEIEFVKLQKEEDILLAKINDLDTREECLCNAQNALADDADNLFLQEDKLQADWLHLKEYEHKLEEAKKYEQSERKHIGEYHKQIGELSLSYHREMKDLKILEQNMYKKLIANKIRELNAEPEEGTPLSRWDLGDTNGFIGQSENQPLKTPQDIEDDKKNLETLLEATINDHQLLQQEIELRLKNTEKLRAALTSET